MKKKLIRLCAWMFMSAISFVAFAGGARTSPVNPAYTRWMSERAHKEVASLRVALNATNNAAVKMPALTTTTDEGEPDTAHHPPMGVIPSLIDYSHLTNATPRLTSVNNGLSRATTTYPTSYDLRTYSRVTPVRDQGDYGTCWAHASLGSIESRLLGLGGGTYSFSVKHLANTHGWGNGFNMGGNAELAIAYLSRLSGSIAESEDPYPNSSYYDDWISSHGGEEVAYGPNSSSYLTVSASPVGTPLKYTLNVAQLTPMTSGTDTTAINAIKAAVQTYGAVYVSYTHSWSSKVWDGKDFYYPEGSGLSVDGGHAVLIVGWNDNYSKSNFATTPPGNGAFLVKNSWGTSGTDANGYCWFSYYDCTFGRGELFSFRTAEDTSTYNKVYTNDRLGRVQNIGNGETGYGANIYTASEDAKIAAVGIYANAMDTSYTISVYTDCTLGSPTSGTLATTQSGTLDAGFFTVQLNTPVKVTASQKFSVVIKLTTPNYDYPLACYLNTYSYDYLWNSSGKYYYLVGTWLSNGEYASDWYIDDDGNDYALTTAGKFYSVDSSGISTYICTLSQMSKHTFKHTSDTATATGTSFYSLNGSTWTDMKNYTPEDSSNVHVTSGYGRFCCKVYTTAVSSKPNLQFVYPSGEGWPAELFLSTLKAIRGKSASFTEESTIYLYEAVGNMGDAATTAGYRLRRQVLNASGSVVKSSYVSISDTYEPKHGKMFSGVEENILQRLQENCARG